MDTFNLSSAEHLLPKVIVILLNIVGFRSKSKYSVGLTEVKLFTISELSHEHVQTPEEVVSIGQDVKVKIKSIDRGKIWKENLCSFWKLHSVVLYIPFETKLIEV